MEKIVKYFNVMMVGVPGIVVFVSWNWSSISPSLLQLFKMLVSCVDVFFNIYEAFNFFNDLQPYIQIDFKCGF
jgi:hypothetical protein